MTSEELLLALHENPFVLAPMAGITAKPFRKYMKNLGAGIVISELVSANGLHFKSEKTMKLVDYDEIERPVGIQLFGERIEVLAAAAKVIEDTGVDFIDLNFGCPVKKVVSKGAGSAVLKDLVQLRKILRAVKSALTIPLTIKIRTGWDCDNRNAEKVCQVAYDEGITWVAIHGRTRSQAYNGLADWDYIKWVKENSPLPVLGNGDISSPQIAVDRMKSTGCDGVMIGRGCLKNPWIFRESLGLWNQAENQTVRDFSLLIKNLKDELASVYEERTTMIQLRKFSAWYATGLPGAARFRRGIYATKTVEETYDYILNYYSDNKWQQRKDTSSEPFLMGGHG